MTTTTVSVPQDSHGSFIAARQQILLTFKVPNARASDYIQLYNITDLNNIISMQAIGPEPDGITFFTYLDPTLDPSSVGIRIAGKLNRGGIDVMSAFSASCLITFSPVM